MKRKWTYDGVMSIWEEVDTRQKQILVLRLGEGLGHGTNSIGNLAAAAPQLLDSLELLVHAISLEIKPHGRIVDAIQNSQQLIKTLKENR